MKNVAIVLFLVNAFLSVSQTEIKFEKNSTLDELKKKAKKENKLIFIDAYTTWCGPCKWISANIFTNEDVAKYYNQSFINAKFDMEDQGEGTRIGSEYQVMCYPNLLFIDGEGKLVHRTAGAEQDPQYYITLGETAKNPEKRFSALEAKYRANPSNSANFKEYMSAVSTTCLDYANELDNFLNQLNEADYLKHENWNIIQEYLTDFNHKTTQYIAKNTSKFSEKFGDQVNDFLFNSIRQTAFDLLNEMDFQENKYQALLNTAKTMELEPVKEIFPMLEIYGYERKSDWEGLFGYLMKNGDEVLDSENKNRYSYIISENATSDVHLKKAEQWMKEVLAEEGGEIWNNLDTYAHVLHKLKRDKEALEYAEKSLNTGEELTEEQITATQTFIEEIKNGN
jgi:thiol-disulfide isomerase/thioredoxin